MLRSALPGLLHKSPSVRVFLLLVLADVKWHRWLWPWCREGDVAQCEGGCVGVRVCMCVRAHVRAHSCCTRALITDISCHPGLSTVAPPIHHGPSVPPAVIPLPPGTHLLFAQTGKIERIPLEGSSMKKAEAKALLHVPVSAW